MWSLLVADATTTTFSLDDVINRLAENQAITGIVLIGSAATEMIEHGCFFNEHHAIVPRTPRR